MAEGELIGGTEWCPECRRKRDVVDDHIEETLESASHSYSTRHNEYRVLDLSCGHSKSWATGKSTTYRDAP